MHEDQKYRSRNVAINIKIDFIVRQTNKVHPLYTTMNDKHILYYNLKVVATSGNLATNQWACWRYSPANS